MFLDRIKRKFPKNASRQEGIRMLVLGIPATVIIAMLLTGFIRWCTNTMIGGM